MGAATPHGRDFPNGGYVTAAHEHRKACASLKMIEDHYREIFENLALQFVDGQS